MSAGNQTLFAGMTNIIWAFLILVFCVGLVGFFWLRLSFRQSLDRADGFELTQRLKRWVEAGKPEGEKLTEFMQGRRPDIVVSNKLFAIGGTNFVTQSALTKPKSGSCAT